MSWPTPVECMIRISKACGWDYLAAINTPGAFCIDGKGNAISKAEFRKRAERVLLALGHPSLDASSDDAALLTIALICSRISK